MITIKNTTDLIRYSNRIGNTYFSPATMRYFSSRVEPEVYGGHYFITSEQDESGHGWDGERRWSVREFEIDDEGITFNTVGEWGAYESADEAREAIAAIGVRS